LEVARLVQKDFAQGVRLAPLAGLADASHLASAIASALGVSFRGPVAPARQLVQHLCTRQQLLVLDNFEHLLDGVSLVTDIVSGAPDVRILVTSRERLNLQEEWVVVLGGLGLPDRSGQWPPDHSAAVQLFVERACQVQANVSISDANRQAIVEICRRVEGLPLALELAATWLRVMPCDRIAEEIGRGLDVLTTTARNVPDRHRSLRAVFDRSWSLLPANQQQVLSRLSVFRGGFDRQAAEQVAGAALEHLTGLVDKSLIRVGAAGRYELHELVRQYLWDKLGDADRAAVSERHFVFFRGLADGVEHGLGSPGQAALYDRLETEKDNLSAALNWTIREQNAEAGLQLAGALGWFWDQRSYPLEGYAWLERLIQMECAAPLPLRAQALRFMAVFMFGDPRAREHAEAALRHAEQIGDQRSIAWALATLGFYAEANLDRAEKLLGEALALFTSLGDSWGVSEARLRLGWILMLRDDFDRARDVLKAALTEAQLRDNTHATACSLFLLGSIAWRQQQDFVAAKTLLEQSARLSDAMGSLALRGFALLALGEIAEARADYEHVRAWYERVQLSAHDSGDSRINLGLALFGIGQVLRAQGQSEQAEVHFRQLLALAQQPGPTQEMAWLAGHGLWGLGALAAEAGDGMRAATLLGAADALLREMGGSFLRDTTSLRSSARAAEFESDVAAARSRFERVPFAQAFATGQALPTDAAVAYASVPVRQA
jgi:predicted ATPase